MNKHHNKYGIWIKSIAISVACLFLFNTIAWAYPDRMTLAVQSIFNPLHSVEIRDIGIIKYYSLCLAKNFEGFESIPGDVNAAISNENINITFEFSRKNEEGLTALLRTEEEYIIPCRINGSLYYVYVTLDESPEIPQITVFTNKEFEKIKAKGSIAHRKRTAKEEKKVTHEQEYDTPLAITHGWETNLLPVSDRLKENALMFLVLLGADPRGEFIREASQFMSLPGTVTMVPSTTLLAVKTGRTERYFPISIDRAHTSNNHINIPQDTHDDIVKILVHELAVKCGLPHSFNEKIDKAYENWRNTGKIIDLPEEYPEISKVISTMRFKDLKEVEERDLGAEGEGHEDEAPPADIPDKTPHVLSLRFITIVGSIIIAVITVLQVLPPIPLANMLKFVTIPGFMNHATLSKSLGFVTFMTMGEICGQYMNLKNERNLQPEKKLGFNWATIGLVFFLTSVLFSWFWSLTFVTWTSFLPDFLTGVADQLVSATFSSLIIFPLHGLITGLTEKRFTGERKLSVIKDILREKFFLFRELSVRSFPYWVIGLGMLFSLPIGLTAKTILVGGLQPPFAIYMFYLVNKKTSGQPIEMKKRTGMVFPLQVLYNFVSYIVNKATDVGRPMRMKKLAKILLPLAVLYNLAYFPFHVSLLTLLIGAAAYVPTIYFGFKKVPDEEQSSQSPEQDGPSEPAASHIAVHPDTRNFKPGGSPADYLAAVGEHKELQDAHVIGDYKETVKPKVADSTIRRGRKKLEERGHLKKGPYRYGKGHEYSLTQEGRERLKLIARYEERAKTATGGFSCAMIDLALSLENGEKVLLALDENLGKEGTERLVRTLLKDIYNMKSDEKLKTILQNLIIIKRRGGRLADEVQEYTGEGKDGIKVKMSNVIMITEDSNKEKCLGFEGEAIITYVDDSRIDMMGYYPLVEVTLFTLAKALHYRGVSKYDTDKLISLYRSVNVEELSEEKIQALYIDKKIVTIILKPAEPFEYDELHHIYKIISTFLQAA